MTSRCVATKESINSSDAAGDSLSIENACHFFFQVTMQGSAKRLSS